eukprot:CAMPEP_0175078410 /NCGR_PEP_ID=MMETSP0052_2-20121109/24099_1 /TAXON_ID=51329 ORGANISM="Polytomella parva, Strain SAG 63-3" /NCGR_SAMPLE_ID=MMETSP0052_2 /ASSEMBLY_ACC=CAM_ASM_000194 /LENGTH=115 /DNA_ID=CAMNT_0016348321 /DNA_START=43 /DNA_END=387 /DNA_ORIENTATION=+
MSSPVKSESLKDAEARVRALTREVGTLREDLRREAKKRERAVIQSQEQEATRKLLESKATELSYSNKKLAAELEGVQDAARAAADRDRRALRSLREGLALVETEVEARMKKGSVH